MIKIMINNDNDNYNDEDHNLYIQDIFLQRVF